MKQLRPLIRLAHWNHPLFDKSEANMKRRRPKIFRSKGKDYASVNGIAIKSPIGTEAFAAEVAVALQQTGADVDTGFELRKLGADYFESKEFKQLEPNTQVQFKRAMRWASPRVRSPVSQLDDAHIRQLQDAAMREARRLAHNVRAALTAVLEWHNQLDRPG